MRRSLDRLINALVELPGIGRKTAQRIALHLLRSRDDGARELVQAVTEAHERLHACPCCFSLTEDETCEVCSDAGRDHSLTCVVEEPGDVLTLEQSGRYRGTYHVLMGHLAPLDGIEPEDLTIGALVERVRSGPVREVVLALNPTLDGDGTALHIRSLLSEFDVVVTRPARGLAVGSQLEYATAGMLESAIRGRAAM